MSFFDDEPETLCARCKVATEGSLVDHTQHAHYRHLLGRALSAVRAMPNRPRELEAFFYEIHGEAL